MCVYANYNNGTCNETRETWHTGVRCMLNVGCAFSSYAILFMHVDICEKSTVNLSNLPFRSVIL